MAKWVWIAIGTLLFVPATTFAQASIAGAVRDTSGAVLPGVTVEVASPALIEQVRVAVTDRTGQYRVENLRPGPYTVTFTLPGFANVLREGIELTGTFVATVNADMQVGSVEETITVTGQAPVVDVRSTTQQRVLDREIIDNIPAGRASAFQIALLVLPGVTTSSRARQDTGGLVPGGSAATVNSAGIHGGSARAQQIFQNGVLVAAAAREGFNRPGGFNPTGTQEVTVDTTAVSAEHAAGGIRVNYVPKDGGNTFSGQFYINFVNEDMQGTNSSKELEDRGLRTPNRIKFARDINPGFGGPILRDKLWFYVSGRRNEDEGFVAGSFENLNRNDPTKWTFDPDLSREVFTTSTLKGGQGRVTWQAHPKNKLGITWQEQTLCQCPSGISGRTAPEAATNTIIPVLRIAQADWTSPVTNRLLLEAGFVHSASTSDRDPQEGHNPAMIAVQEQSTGLRFRAPRSFRTQPAPSDNFRAAVSYIPGAHALKVGFQHRTGQVDFSQFDLQPVNFRFNRGVPNRVTLQAFPVRYIGDIDRDIGVYAQDRWTINRWTLSGGVRYDHFSNSFPETFVGPAVLAPDRNFTFPRQDNLSLDDITPKLGASWDVAGDGRTAVKVTFNKYLENLGGGFLGDRSYVSGAAPANALITGTTRSWTDANSDFVPDCDLTNPAPNGECGRMRNPNFGKVVPARTFDPDILTGWGKRGYDWEFSASVNRELVPRVALEVGFFRRWFGNFKVTDNRTLSPSDFDEFSITAPVDARLPGGGGQVIPGLFDVKPEKFGLPTDNFVTLADNFGKQTQRFNGVDVLINARPQLLGGPFLLQGGISTGRTETNNCDVVTKLDNPSPLYCEVKGDFLTQARFVASYTIAPWDVSISMAFQSLPGPEIIANFNAGNSVVQPSLGRRLAGRARNTSVNLVEPGTEYDERTTRLDVRVAKILRFGGTRTSLNVDLFNVFNSNDVQLINPNFRAFRRPEAIITARFVRLSANFTF